ncbi:MAG: C25 family cysteine peptidase [Caldilinea sp.]|nr:C25 family cysteine peptidase [Caldilinea sp.]MDW8439756.1 C25 family cysteine peptidase [Caldilineaceae bacterium]
MHTTRKTTSQLLLLILLLFAYVSPASAQMGETPAGLSLTVEIDGAHLVWRAPEVSVVTLETIRPLLPIARHQGYDLPIQTIALAIPSHDAPSVVVEHIASVPLAGEIEPGAPIPPPVLEWTPSAERLTVEAAQLPSAPVFILREGVVKGQRFVVLAVSPIYRTNDGVQVATSLKAFIPGATLLMDQLEQIAAASASSQFVQMEMVSVPINQAALQNGYKLIVNQPGLQEVPFSALTKGYDANRLHLTHRGETVAVEVLADRFRFYAPTVGDRWNQASVYWLTFDGAGERMADGENGAASAPSGQAYELGVWRENKFYSSLYAGTDDDHWFHGSLTVAGNATAAFPSVTLPVTAKLPDASGQSIYTATVTVIGATPTGECPIENGYRLRFTSLDGADQPLDTQVSDWNPWNKVGYLCRVSERNWQLSIVTAVKPAGLRLTLLPSGYPTYTTSILLDSVEWMRPVTLNFGGSGAEFWTPAGAWSFSLSNLPAARALYDVTDPLHPVKIPIGAGATATLHQSTSPTPRHYALARLDSLPQPFVIAHTAVNFGAVEAADAIYISPAQWRSLVQPLLDLRTEQGYTPLFVDVQAIFDVYGYGYVSAPAIRNFLRHRTDWQNPTRIISVVLVGDGTYDPYNYENRTPAGAIHPIPPYMADVDLYINEVPCETCFAQLNGDDPVTGDDPDALNPKTNVFVPDVWLGRLPVRNETELSGVVNKIVAYERAGGVASWGSTQVFLADNFIVSINDQHQVRVDPAGDFAFFSDEVMALTGYGAHPQRIYYDHSPTRIVTGTIAANGLINTVARPTYEPWRIPSITEAQQKTFKALNDGAGLVIYNGHGNWWNYAKLEDRNGVGEAPIFSTVEAVTLANRDKPFVNLAMTCMSSQFAKPAIGGTLDELLIRNPNGGAVATWGPTGQSVAHGHDYLQKGFVSKLRNSPPGSRRIGELVTAGYQNLLTSPLTGALDSLKTFAVFGDPLTRPRITAGFDNGIFLPLVQR